VPGDPGSRAWTQNGVLAVIGYAGAFCSLGVAALFAALWLRSRKSLQALLVECSAIERQQADLATVLDTVPIALFCFAAGGEDGALPDGYGEILAGLAPDDAARLEAARLALRRGAGKFSLSAATADGRGLTIEGRTTASGKGILWLLDGSMASAIRERDAAAGLASELREMIDAIPMPVWRCDESGAIVDCNRAYASALGLAGGARPASFPALLPRQPDPLVAADELARDRHRVGHVVIRGTRRLLEIAEVARDTGGAIGFAIDRTDVEAAQSELCRHIDAHGEVLEGIHEGVAIYGADQRLKYFNAAFAALWGIGEEWLAGEPTLGEVLEWLRERRRIPERIDFRACKREHLEMFTQLIEPRQEMMHLPDGRTLQLSVSPHPLGGLIFLYEDVTDYLALECSLNTLAQVQRATLDHLFEGIAVFGSDGRLKLHNPAYRKIWRLSEEDVAEGPHVAQIVDKMRGLLDDGGDWNATKQAVIDKIAAQVPTRGLLNRCDGSLLQTAIVPLPDGEVLLTYLDVSDTARVEQALREKNEALEIADRLKSEFIANVSYELRTPLNAVIGFTEILNNQYFGTLNPRQLDYSRSILDSAYQLTALINDILDLATIEAGYLLLEQERVDVPRMLKAVAVLTEERARHQGLKFEFCCPAQIGTIEADERRLKQALFNLISNAIKFTPPGGTVSVAAERRGEDLLLSVADTGIGIAPADQARVFGKFERGARQSGVGLGLALVKKLIELHGGTVSIESAPERGTRILCHLPARRHIGRKSAHRRKDRTRKAETSRTAPLSAAYWEGPELHAEPTV
jgi:signal transduction histidine kinase